MFWSNFLHAEDRRIKKIDSESSWFTDYEDTFVSKFGAKLKKLALQKWQNLHFSFLRKKRKNRKLLFFIFWKKNKLSPYIFSFYFQCCTYDVTFLWGNIFLRGSTASQCWQGLDLRIQMEITDIKRTFKVKGCISDQCCQYKVYLREKSSIFRGKTLDQGCRK